jgi:diacylglycerol kinase (ATP)
MRATLIYNPHAGFGSWQETMSKVAEVWQAADWHVTLRPTEYAGHATLLAQQAAEAGHHLVIAAGGDGTLNEVANGLVHTPTAVALLPVGTGNSFARELGLTSPNLLEPHKLFEAAQQLLLGKGYQMDVGQLDSGRYWLLWVGTGADGYVIEQIEPRSKLFKRLGRGGYAAKGLLFLPGFTGMQGTITIDEKSYTGDFLLINISNCRLFGGGEFVLNAEGVLDDGQFEVWIFRGSEWPTLRLMRYILEMSLENHADDPKVERVFGRSIRITAEPPIGFHADGEPLGRTPLATVIHPRALRLVVPPSAPADLFRHPPIGWRE